MRARRATVRRGRPPARPPRRLTLTALEPREADVLASVLRYLELCKRQGRVGWYVRANSGAGRLLRKDGTAGQWMRFGWPGCPDVLGQLPDGRLLAVECKSRTGRIRPNQQAFLDLARAGGACAGVARSIDDVDHLLEDAGWPSPYARGCSGDDNG